MGYTVEDTVEWCRGVASDADESMLCLFDAAKPVGVAMLVENDLAERPALGPWLSSLYVLPEYRGLGLGRRLASAAIERVRRMRRGNLYLYVQRGKLEGYYASLGFRTAEALRLRDKSFLIMQMPIEQLNRD